MNKLVYLFFVSLFFVGPITSGIPSLGRYIGLIPELFSVLFMVLILARVAVNKTFALKPQYMILATLVVFHVLGGLFINSVSPGTFITGIRPYLKWVPLFLLPAAYHFSPEEISRQLKFILILALLQCPVALYQRLFEFHGIETGDVITGTLGAGGSGALSLILLSSIAVLLSFYAKRRIRFTTFMGLTIILFIPTTINETKVTLFLLPIVVMVPLLVGTDRRVTGFQLAGIAAIIAIMIAGFVPVYKLFQPSEMSDPLSAGGVASYLYAEKKFDLTRIEKLSDNKIVGIVRQNPKMIDKKEAGGRIDNVLLPLRILSEDPVRLWAGLGVGNVSISFFSAYSGEYSRRIGQIGNELSLSFLIWETGIGGAFLFFLFLILIIKDAYSLSAARDIIGAIASGWVAVVGVTMMSMTYNNLLLMNALIFLFAYFSGVLAAERGYVGRNSKM